MPPGHLLGYPGRLVLGEVVQDQDLEGPLAEEGGEGAPQFSASFRAGTRWRPWAFLAWGPGGGGKAESYRGGRATS
jgi:hypothetical protein